MKNRQTLTKAAKEKFIRIYINDNTTVCNHEMFEFIIKRILGSFDKKKKDIFFFFFLLDDDIFLCIYTLTRTQSDGNILTRLYVYGVSGSNANRQSAKGRRLLPLLSHSQPLYSIHLPTYLSTCFPPNKKKKKKIPHNNNSKLIY